MCALNSVSVKTLGSSMGADTIIEVGVDPTLKSRIQQMQKEIAEAARVVKSVQPLLEISPLRWKPCRIPSET